MFLFDIIPGSSKPLLTCLNYYLHLLGDMLLEFWFTGICFSCTSTYYYGRVLQCALILLDGVKLENENISLQISLKDQ